MRVRTARVKANRKECVCVYSVDPTAFSSLEDRNDRCYCIIMSSRISTYAAKMLDRLNDFGSISRLM